MANDRRKHLAFCRDEFRRPRSDTVKQAVGSLLVRTSDSRPEGLDSMLDAIKYPPSTQQSTFSLNQWVRKSCGRGCSRKHECKKLENIFPSPPVPCLNCRGGDIDGDRFNSCQVIYSQFGLAIHQNDHQARRRFVEWAQNEIAVVPDFHKRILFSNETHFWLNGYVNKQNCRIWSEANPQVYVETPLHPEKLTVWCALWAGGILLQKR
ncbi:hypothetical protein TNCV_1554331 [Trichonephila clavipes]|nr:hypothetical protein TNCV_1554331 [Trichonephila clavipes]